MALDKKINLAPLPSTDRPTAVTEQADLPTSPTTLGEMGEGMKGVAEISPTLHSLESSLQKDIKGAEAAFSRAQEERGGIDLGQFKKFQEKGIRLGKRVIAQEQFNRASQAQQNALDMLINKSGMVDEAEKIEMSNRINNRLNQLKMDLIKKGIEFEKRLGEYKSSELQKVQARKLFGRLAGTAVGGILGGIFGGGQGAMGGSQIGGGVGGSLL